MVQPSRPRNSAKGAAKAADTVEDEARPLPQPKPMPAEEKHTRLLATLTSPRAAIAAAGVLILATPLLLLARGPEPPEPPQPASVRTSSAAPAG